MDALEIDGGYALRHNAALDEVERRLNTNAKQS